MRTAPFALAGGAGAVVSRPGRVTARQAAKGSSRGGCAGSAAAAAMPGTLEVPSLEELEVPQVNVSSAVLKAAAHHYGSQCDKSNKEFMLCRWEEKDPRKCLKEGKEVNQCALQFFRQVKLHCAEPFTQYWTCIDYTKLQELRHCRQQQQLFDECVLEKLGWVRPDLGQLSKVTKVKTDRPLPDNPYHSRPKPPPNPPVEGELKPARYGSRMYFWNQ